jgi:hypothetical protein
MARPHRRVVLALVAGTVLFAAPAQALRALHVDALSMRADRTQLQVGQVFHLAIHARVRERVAALDELVVPDVGTMKLEGDERHVTSSAAGTDIVETLTLEPTESGSFTFNGAYLDAVDARTGKPSRFSANPVRVVVAKPVAGVLYPNAVQLLAEALVVVLMAGAVAGAILVALVLMLRRRRVPPVPAPAGPPAVPQRTPRDAVAAALRAYRAAPANGSLTQLREALFDAAGAVRGATLRDALSSTPDRALHVALTAAERTAFGPAHVRDDASAELVDATESWLR